jgi:hypothetical protein
VEDGVSVVPPQPIESGRCFRLMGVEQRLEPRPREGHIGEWRKLKRHEDLPQDACQGGRDVVCPHPWGGGAAVCAWNSSPGATRVIASCGFAAMCAIFTLLLNCSMRWRECAHGVDQW